MATPRVKRALAGSATDPAQRPITSFFARDENSPAYGASERSSRSPSHEISSPLLPPSVQANLLAVGMRVRKSVPEGYKTGKEINDRSTPSHYQPQPKAPSTYNTYTSSYKSFLQSAGRPAGTTVPAAAPAPAPAPHQRELLPFCGLDKIGGFDVQSHGNEDGRPMFVSSLFSGMDDDAIVGAGDMEPPLLTSSQETVSSMSSLPASQSQSQCQTVYAAKKRVLGEDEDEYEDEDVRVHEDMHKSASINAWLADGQISPRTQTPLFHLGRRVLAVPRRRQQQQQQRSPSLSVPQAATESPKLAEGQLPQPGGFFRVYDQENAGDFDEAEFLDDMEMSGM